MLTQQTRHGDFYERYNKRIGFREVILIVLPAWELTAEEKLYNVDNKFYTLNLVNTTQKVFGEDEKKDKVY